MRTLGLSLLASVTFTALALPTGFAVAEGEASISSADKSLRVAQTTADTQINWSGFDIAADELVHFELPNNSSVSRNMISGNASTIAGTLSSNGRLFLSNPAGIFFTPEATIDAASVVANSDNGLIEFNSKVSTNELNLQASSINIAGVNLAQDNLDIRLIGDDIVIGQNVALNLNHSQWIVAGENVDNQAQVKLSADSYYYEGQNKTYARALPNMTHKTDRSMAHFEQVKGKLWFKGRDELLADSNKVTYFSSGAQVDLDLALDWQLEDKLPGVSQYMYGDDYHENVAHYKAIRANYKPGVDLKYYGNSADALELDVIVAPYADPEVALTFSSTPEKQGEFLKLTDGIMLDAPVAYQQTENGRRIVESSFKVEGNTVGFNLGDYDVSKELVIDPITVGYATWFGNDTGSANPEDLQVDDAGNYYLVVQDSQSNSPQATTVLFGSKAANQRGLHKFTSSNQHQFSAYLPLRTNESQRPSSLASSTTSVYFTSRYSNFGSGTLPVAPAASLQGTVPNDTNTIVTLKLNKSTGALENYTYYGDSTTGNTLSSVWGTGVDSDGNLIIAGQSFTNATDFMSITDARRLSAKPSATNSHAVVAKIAPALDSLISYQYFGTSGTGTTLRDAKVMTNDKVLIIGYTNKDISTPFTFPSDGANLNNMNYGDSTSFAGFFALFNKDLSLDRSRGFQFANTGGSTFPFKIGAGSDGNFYIGGYHQKADEINVITELNNDNTRHPDFTPGYLQTKVDANTSQNFLIKFNSSGQAIGGTYLAPDFGGDSWPFGITEVGDNVAFGMVVTSDDFFDAMPATLKANSTKQKPVVRTSGFVSMSKDLTSVTNFNVLGTVNTDIEYAFGAIAPSGNAIFAYNAVESLDINISTTFPSVTGQLQNTIPSTGFNRSAFLYVLTKFADGSGGGSSSTSATVNTNETLRQIPPSVLNVATTTTTTTTINTNTSGSNSDSSTIDSLLDSGTADEGSESGDGESADNKKKKSSTTQQPAKTDTQSDTTANPEASSVLTKELGEGVTLYSEDNGVTWKDGSGVRYEFINGEWVRVQ